MPYARRGGRDESNYRHVTRELAVVIAGRYAGSLRVYERGHASFEYDGAYSGPSISVRMPVSGERFLDDVVRPWVEGRGRGELVARRGAHRAFREQQPPRREVNRPERVRGD